MASESPKVKTESNTVKHYSLNLSRLFFGYVTESKCIGENNIL